MQASGHKQRPWEAEILCLELSPEEGFTPDKLVQRALQPSLRVVAWQVTTLPEKASSPALGSSPRLSQGDHPRPWQESDGHRAQGCRSGDHMCPPSSAAWLTTGAQQVGV